MFPSRRSPKRIRDFCVPRHHGGWGSRPLELTTVLCRESKQKTAHSHPSSRPLALGPVPWFWWKELGLQGSPRKEGWVTGTLARPPSPSFFHSNFPTFPGPCLDEALSMLWAEPEHFFLPWEACPAENSR